MEVLQEAIRSLGPGKLPSPTLSPPPAPAPVLAPVLSFPPPECPVCNRQLPGLSEVQISNHIDECLTKSFLDESSVSEPSLTEEGTLVQSVDEPRVKCPYYRCGLTMTVLEFAYHVCSSHQGPHQNVFCPICTLLGEDVSLDVSRLNLWSHLNSDHADIMSVAVGQNGGEKSQPPMYPPPQPPNAFRSAPKAPIPTLRFPHQWRVGNFSSDFRTTTTSATAVANNAHVRKADGYTNDYWVRENYEDQDEEFESYNSDEDDLDGINELFCTSPTINASSFLANRNRSNNDNVSSPSTNLANIFMSSESTPLISRSSLPPPPPPPLPLPLLKALPSLKRRLPSTTSTTISTTTTTTGTPYPDSMVSANYMAYTLKGNLPEKECSICFDDFEEGETVARVECMCIFHHCCIEQWFEKKKCCPFHMSTPTPED